MFDELGLNFDDLDDLQSLVDQVLSEKQAEEGFIIFLRLSPVPKYLVEGYDFKMLNRYGTFKRPSVRILSNRRTNTFPIRKFRAYFCSQSAIKMFLS